MSSLALKARGKKVSQLQELLTHAGYSTLIDGEFGPDTERAVKDFQFDYGLLPDGKVADETWNALLKSQPEIAVIQKGSRSETVVIVQNILNRLGYSLKQDGIFGKATQKAVTKFQKKYHLKTDGIVGPQTWEMLLDKYARANQSRPTKPTQGLESDSYSLLTWDPVTNERIKTLHPKVRPIFLRFINRVESELKIQLRVTSALRTFKEQNKLYAQGRITPGPIVTYAKAGRSYHNYGLAADVVEIKNGKALWNNPAWDDIANIAKELGMEWGGDWFMNPDRPHFYLSMGLTTKELRNLYTEGPREGEYILFK